MLLGGHATSLLKWHRHLPQLREVLRKAEFVALDLELTGLHARAEKFLGVDQCYAAHTEGARSFMPVQLGLCAARRSELDASRWILSPASIYIFPQNPRVFQVRLVLRAATFLTERALHAWRSTAVSLTGDASAYVPQSKWRKRGEGNLPTSFARKRMLSELVIFVRAAVWAGHYVHPEVLACECVRLHRVDFLGGSIHPEAGKQPLFQRQFPPCFGRFVAWRTCGFHL
ncbi:hypothetical protein Emag_003082 [Eimeria magna]